jgi:hypothetical protein
VNARWDEAVDVLEQRALVLGHVHRRARSLGEVGDGAEMVPVPVRDQDRRAAGAEAGQLETKASSVVAGIHDDRLGGAALGAHHVTVGAGAAERIRVDDKSHRRSSLTRGIRLGFSRCRAGI